MDVELKAETEKARRPANNGAGKRRQHESTIRQISNRHECLWPRQAAGLFSLLLVDKSDPLPNSAVGPHCYRRIADDTRLVLAK